MARTRSVETEVPKGFLCPGCMSFTATQNPLSPHCVLFCVRTTSVPPRLKFLSSCRSTSADGLVRSGSFLCSQSGDFTPTEPGLRNPEPRRRNPEPRRRKPEPRRRNPEPRQRNPEPRTKTTYSGVKETVYLSQWINIGSTPRLVMFDRGSSSNLIAGELAEEENLEILSARAGRIRVAGGQQVSTYYGLYKAVVGPSNSGEYFYLNCQGISTIEETSWRSH